MDLQGSMGTLGGWIRSFVELGIGLIGAFLIVDILFPGTTNIVANVGGLVNSFASQGLVGLIALLIFLNVLKR